MRYQLNKSALLGTFLHAFVLLFVTLYWLSLPNIYSDETFLIKWTSLIKKTVFHIDPKPDPAEVLFVDVSKNKTAVPTLNEFEEFSDYHRKVIIDRGHLAEFLAVIVPYQEEIPYVFFDFLMEDESADDSLFLAKANSVAGKLLIGSRINKDGKYIPPIFDLESGLVTYQTSQGLFLKNTLYFQDSLKTGPLVLLEKIDGVQSRRKWGINWLNDQLSLAAPIVDFKVRPVDFKMSGSLEEQNFSIHQLGTILELGELMAPEDIKAYFANKLIVVGDFEKDMHQTIFGAMPGPLIFYNSYLTLKNGAYQISFAWLLFLFLGFWFLSYVAFTEIKFKWPSFLQKPQKEWIEQTLVESFILMTMTILSYAIFNIHINILILIVYLSVITFLWNYGIQFLNTKKKQNQ